MNSPHTGKPMPIEVSKADLQFRGEHFWIHHIYYLCTDTQERFTDEALDTLNLYQAYQQYAEKHNLPIEAVMPKEMVPITGQDNTLNFHKIIADTPQEIKDRVDQWMNEQDQLHQDELELLSCPGDTILETLEEKGMHLLDFALAMDRLPEEIQDIITGKTPINQLIAEQLETVLGIDAQFWLNSEANYRAKLAELTKPQP